MKKLITGGMVALAFLGFSSARSLAQGSATFNVDSSVSGAGQWHVTVNEVGTSSVYDISVIATPGNNPAAVGHSVSVTFFKEQQPANTPLGKTAIGATSGTGGVQQGATFYVWNPTTPTYSANGTVKWNVDSSTGAPPAIATNGSNYFTAQMTLDGFNTQAGSVWLSVQDGSTSLVWQGGATLVPEGGSLALLLPGIFPLGMFLKRRKKVV